MNYLQLNKLPELPFNVEEALNQLRINLGFSGSNLKTVMVTSSTSNEGKSFITVNLWKQMAELGNRVLLIDCDMRNSEMRYKYGFQTEDGKLSGVVHYLSGKAELKDVIYETNVTNGYLIPVATNIANPTVLLESERFKEMMTLAKEQFDFIILDTPPLGAVADALNLAGYCDGSLLVIRSGEVPRRMVKNSVDLLQRTDTPLLGYVLNRADTTARGNYYYYNHYYYGYGDYGYGKGKKKKSSDK